MWIDNKFYQELVDTLEAFSKGDYTFEQRNFSEYHQGKYTRVTDALARISSKSDKNINNCAQMLSNIATGDCRQINYTSANANDYQVIYDSYNHLSQSMNELTERINQLKQNISQGELNCYMDESGLNGIWQKNIHNINQIVTYFVKNKDEFNRILRQVSAGDLSQRITTDAKGEMLDLKITINTLVDQLSQFAQELTRVAKEVGTDGILGGQAKIDNVTGTWLELTNNVNDMASSLTNQVRNISEVTAAVAKGDLSQKITANAQGEVQELKNTINTMVDQLCQFVSEINKVTKEVGSGGQFGIQAEVDDISGVWLELTNNVNVMSRSLARVDKKNKQQQWIKDGITNLSKEILHKDFILEQFQTAIIYICRYIKASMGTIYIYDSTTNKLNLEASYAYRKDRRSTKGFCMGEGIIGQVAYDRKPILMQIDDESRVIRAGTTDYQVTATYTAPLLFKGNLVGVIEVATHRSFTTLELEYLESALSVLSGSFYAAILQTKNRKELELLSNTDALTNLYNRGYFDKKLAEILNETKRRDGLMCFAMIDIDYFKDFNDQYGHQTGDEVLKTVSKVLQANLRRKSDYCFRIGGEEFAIIFSARKNQNAYEFMDRIRKEISNTPIKNVELDIDKRITISMGVTCKRALIIPTAECLYDETDKLLYKAKKTGRNKVIANKTI